MGLMLDIRKPRRSQKCKEKDNKITVGSKISLQTDCEGLNSTQSKSE